MSKKEFAPVNGLYYPRRSPDGGWDVLSCNGGKIIAHLPPGENDWETECTARLMAGAPYMIEELAREANQGYAPSLEILPKVVGPGNWMYRIRWCPVRKPAK